jgi:hypothetical protein
MGKKLKDESTGAMKPGGLEEIGVARWQCK